MSLERLFDMVVEFPIGACRLSGVNITTADDVAVVRVEIQRTRYVLELWKREKLNRRVSTMIKKKKHF